MTTHRSANEIEALVLKAARGGGLTLGYAEDLAAITKFLDLDRLTVCPCAGADPAAICVQTALDGVAAGEGPQAVTADAALIAAYVTAAQIMWQKHLIWTSTPTGAVFEQFEDAPPETATPLGRRSIPQALATHLADMAAKTLVPETDTSRQAGAGAGLTDND